MFSHFLDFFKIVERGEIPTWVSISSGNVSQIQTQCFTRGGQKKLHFQFLAVPVLLRASATFILVASFSLTLFLIVLFSSESISCMHLRNIEKF